MFNVDFFPTPVPVIRKMIDPYVKSISYGGKSLAHRRILEPSAGKGDILDHLTQYYYVKKDSLLAIEIEDDLVSILQGKGYNVVDRDFLCYNDASAYLVDLIIMNPPFSNGARHLLHAWEILRQGDIVSLLNAETVRNPYTAERRLLLSIIEAHGSVEYIGQVFKTAERTSDVEVALVRLNKPAKTDGVDFDTTGFNHEAAAADREFTAQELANSDLLQSLVDQYSAAAQALIDVHDARKRYEFYIKSVRSQDRYGHDDNKVDRQLNEDLTALKKLFWKYVFDRTKVAALSTSEVQKKFMAFIESSSTLAFSRENIMRVLEQIFLSRDDIVKQCILEVFDQCTRYHEKNAVHPEGWKTNKSWKIAKKVIMPYYRWYSRNEFFADFDKALCFVGGKSYEDILTTIDAMKAWEEDKETSYGDTFASEFFEIRVYKKGTVHMKFRDLDLHAQFNQAAAKGKGWLGAGY